MTQENDLAARNEEIFSLRERGMTLADIAKRFHLSRQRVRQIHLGVKERKESFDSWPPLKKKFSRRIQNALGAYFVNEKFLDDPQKIVAEGRIGIHRIKNIGKKSIREIALVLYELGYLGWHDEWLKPYRRDKEFLGLRVMTTIKGKKGRGEKGSGLSSARLDKMIDEATVDCYNESEQRCGLFTMIEENLALPFRTLVLGVEVVVEKVDLTEAEEIVGVCRRGSGRQRIPILDLPLPDPRPAGAQWIEAYRRWCRGI